jgi:uncharacterized membrane protein YidH (DUF202 family)
MAAPQQVLDDWYERVAILRKPTTCQRASLALASAGSAFQRWCCQPLVGTSVFATAQKQPEPWLQIAVGLASIAAALLASLQTFLGYSERAQELDRHVAYADVVGIVGIGLRVFGVVSAILGFGIGVAIEQWLSKGQVLPYLDTKPGGDRPMWHYPGIWASGRRCLCAVR